MLIERKALLPRGALFINERKPLQKNFYANNHANDIAFFIGHNRIKALYISSVSICL